MGRIEELIELPEDPYAGGSGEVRHFGVRFLGRQNNPKYPLTIPNELVAGFIGQCLGLNAPTVMPYRSDEGMELALVRWHDFAKAPSADVARFVLERPHEVHGAIVFDLFVANNDRALGPKRRNIEFGRDGTLYLIDQGNACYYRDRGGFNGSPEIVAGIPRLDAVEADLAAMNDVGHMGNHYFQLLTDWRLVEEWCDRIRALPDFLIESAVGRVPASFSRPTPQERERLLKFLLRRKDVLIDDIRRCGSKMFPGLPECG